MGRTNVFLVLAFMMLALACTPRSREVVVRETGRIVDAEGRAALLEVRQNGDLLFDSSISSVDSLTPGSTLVMEPTPGAPYGLCRKIVDRAEAGGTVTLTTEPGQLWEVIQNGGFELEEHLDPVDLAVMDPARGFDISVGYVLIDTDGDLLTTNDQVRFEGAALLDVGHRLRWQLFDAGGLFDDLNPFDSFELEFEASVGIEEDLSLSIVAAPVGIVDHEVRAYHYPFPPKTIFVGPVPVVLTPQLTVDVGARGEFFGKGYEMGARQWFVAKLGAKCDPGCDAISRLEEGFEAGAGAMAPGDSPFSADLEGYVRVTYDLLVYGVAGPFGSLEPHLSLDARYPRRPAWDLDGGLVALGGVKVSPLGISWDAELFRDTWDLAESGNNPPAIEIYAPAPDATLLVGTPVEIRAQARDLEQGLGCCRIDVRSDVDGDLGSTTDGRIMATFDTPGPRTLVATAEDADGVRTETSVEVSAVNVPPDITFLSPSDGSFKPRGAPFLLQVRAIDANEPGGRIPCGNGVFGGGGAGADLPRDLCDLDDDGVGFAVLGSNGAQTITVTATDREGSTDAESIDIQVVDPPANYFPEVGVTSPTAGFEVNANTTTVPLQATVYDHDDSSISYLWRVNWNCDRQLNSCASSAIVTSGTLLGTNVLPGVVQLYTWSPHDHLPIPSCGSRYDARLDWDFDGTANGVGGQLWFAVSRPPC